MDIDPKEIKGAWDAGYVLDKHTISSTMIGYNESGYPEFDTLRSPLGELVYKLKYKGDKAVLPELAKILGAFIAKWGIRPDVIVPLPPSKQRAFQPMIELTKQLGATLHIPVEAASLTKTGATPQMKDIGNYPDRVKALEAVLTVGEEFKGKVVLLIDDLFQSGATMNVAARVIRGQGRSSGSLCTSANSHEGLTNEQCVYCWFTRSVEAEFSNPRTDRQYHEAKSIGAGWGRQWRRQGSATILSRTSIPTCGRVLHGILS